MKRRDTSHPWLTRPHLIKRPINHPRSHLKPWKNPLRTPTRSSPWTLVQRPKKWRKVRSEIPRRNPTMNPSLPKKPTRTHPKRTNPINRKDHTNPINTNLNLHLNPNDPSPDGRSPISGASSPNPPFKCTFPPTRPGTTQPPLPPPRLNPQSPRS